MPFVYRQFRVRKMLTRIVLHPEPGAPTWELFLDDRVVKKRVWEIPYWESALQEIEAMKREASEKQKGKGKYIPMGDPWIGTYPLVEEYMGDCWWDDGKPRVPCHLKLEVMGGAVSIALIDTEGRRSCHTTGKTFNEALSLLESHMEAGGAPWRSWGPQKGR